MKNLNVMISGLVLAILTQAAPASALVKMDLNCKTSDGKYTVVIEDNQGIGPVRTSHLYAMITNAEGITVGNYAVTLDNPIMRSISFGHASYLSSEDRGQSFDLALPSTNTPYALTATLQDGQRLIYGVILDPRHENQGTLSCSNL
jgi:hypothetical protein